MGFFTRDDARKDDSKRSESERLTGKVDPKALAKKMPSLRTFVLGLRPGEKLLNLPADRLEEGLKAVLPKGSKVSRAEGPAILSTRDAHTRFFEVSLPAQEMPEALGLLMEKGLLDGQVHVAFDQCVVVCDASGKSAQLALSAETIDRAGMRFLVKTDSPEVLVQYPPIDVHKRWLADDDYRAAYGRWRTQRSDDVKPPRWHSGWAAAGSDDAGPPWVRLKPREGKPDEYVLDFEDSMLLRFAFQGAVIRIERFNLKILANRLTGEVAHFRSLPLSLESIPKEVQDRMNREPERFRALREQGKFGASFDLVRVAYEELGGDYFHSELPATAPPAPVAPPPPAAAPAVPPAAASAPVPVTPVVPAPLPVAEPSSLQSGPLPRPDKKELPPPRLGTAVPGSGTQKSVKPSDAPKTEKPEAEAK